MLSGIAQLLFKVGEREAAERLAAEKHLVFEHPGAARTYAILKAGSADKLEKSGDVTGALRVFQEEVPPAFQQSGDRRLYTILQGRVATILIDRGELDAALPIVEEALATYELAGDIRHHSFALMRRAEIMRLRGDPDEALRILGDQAEPETVQWGSEANHAVGSG